MPGREYPTWGDKRLKWGMVGLYYGLPLASYITDPPDLTKRGVKHTMRLPDDQDELESLGYAAAAGAHQLEDVINLRANRHDDIIVDVRAFSDSRARVDRADAVRKRSYEQQATRAAEMRAWLTVARDVLVLTLGKKWTSVWAEAGWNENSLEIPRKAEEAMPILRAQTTYLTAHPEVANADPRYNYTLARANEVLASMNYSFDNTDDTGGKIIGTRVAEQKYDAEMQTRKLTEASLRRRLRGLQGELEQLIPADSPHWTVFGFNQPGTKNSPGPMTTATAEPLGGGRLMVRWENPVRTDYVQIWAHDQTTTTYTLARRADGGTETLLESLAPGTQLTLKLRAGNTTGYGHYSTEIKATIT